MMSNTHKSNINLNLIVSMSFSHFAHLPSGPHLTPWQAGFWSTGHMFDTPDIKDLKVAITTTNTQQTLCTAHVEDIFKFAGQQLLFSFRHYVFKEFVLRSRFTFV